MSRGLGFWQRMILDLIANSDELIPLVEMFGAPTRSEYAAILRAAKSLEKAGRCVIVRLWDYDEVVRPFIVRPDLTIGGTPAKELSVERVPCGTGTAIKGSCRHMAHRQGVSKSTAARDRQWLKKEGQKPPSPNAP